MPTSVVFTSVRHCVYYCPNTLHKYNTIHVLHKCFYRFRLSTRVLTYCFFNKILFLLWPHITSWPFWSDSFFLAPKFETEPGQRLLPLCSISCWNRPEKSRVCIWTNIEKLETKRFSSRDEISYVTDCRKFALMLSFLEIFVLRSCAVSLRVTLCTQTSIFQPYAQFLWDIRNMLSSYSAQIICKVLLPDFDLLGALRPQSKELLRQGLKQG